MGSEWIETTLGEVSTDISYGYTESASNEKIGPRFLRITDIQNGVVDWNTVPFCPIDESQKSKYLLENGDIVVARTGNSTGENYIFTGKEEAVYASYLIRFKIDRQRANPLYVWYSMRSSAWWAFIEASKTGSAQAGANAKVLSLFQFKLPNRQSQDAIAHILSTLDDKIKLNRQMNTTLEAMAQALFRSWFVDFDPVIDNALAAGNPIPEALQAKAEARKALGDKRKPLPDAVQQQFPSGFVFSDEMGWVPEEWGFEKLRDRIDVLNGFAFKSKDYASDGIFVLRTKNFNAAGVVEYLSDDVYLPYSFSDSHEKYLCEEYDYHLIMVGASVGNRGLIQPHILPALRNQNMWCFRPIKGYGVSKAFVKYMLDNLIVEKLGLASGSAREFFRKGDFQNHKVGFGNDIIQTIFNEYAFPYLKKQAANEAQNKELSIVRDTLLPKLLSGKLSIPDAEKQIAEVV